MRACARQPSAIHDKVLLTNRLLAEPAFENLPRPRCVAGLCRQRGTGGVRGHPVMRHGSPRMIPRCRLREPDVTSVACQLAAFERAGNCIAIADLAACSINDVSTAFHLRDHSFIEQILGFRVPWAVDGHDVAYLC